MVLLMIFSLLVLFILIIVSLTVLIINNIYENMILNYIFTNYKVSISLLDTNKNNDIEHLVK